MQSEPLPSLTLQATDADMLRAWRHFSADLLRDQPQAVLRQRFCALGLFPKPGWARLIGGEALAVQQQDVHQLHGTLQRVLAAAHAQALADGKLAPLVLPDELAFLGEVPGMPAAHAA